MVSKTIANDINALTLWMVSGKKIVYMLDEYPKITFQDDEFVLSTHMNMISYHAADILKYTLSHVTTADIKKQMIIDAVFTFEGDCVKGFNLEPLSKIEMYTVDGKLLSVLNTDCNGTFCIYTPINQEEVYIIKTPVTNFKIKKP